LGFKYNQWERKLYLAVPSDIYHSEFHKPLFQDSVQTYHVNIHNDPTEEGIANILVQQGIPPSDIILEYQPPTLRSYTPFATT
jgi:XisI protein